MDKEQQKKLITEIMEADEKNGLYKQQTAVDYLIEQLDEQIYRIAEINAFQFGVSEGFLTDINYMNCDEDAEYYYNETYGGQGSADITTSPTK